MIDHLSTLLKKFPGSANRTRCFAHILNLVAKCIMRQFDGPKATKKGNAANNDNARALDSLAGELEEDEATDDNEAMDVDDDVELEGDNNEGIASDEEDDELVEEARSEMTEDEVKDLEAAVKPVKLVLVKVHSS